jgi:uncharacterized protein YprB with RNaseH-like and TPR domain
MKNEKIMSSIKDKLQRLDRTGSTRPEYSEHENRTNEKWIDEFESEIGASVIREKNSFIVLKENYFPLYKNSIYSESGKLNYILRHFHYISGDSRTRDWNLRKTLFIDLETTGLAGGTGTFAFLVGLGHIELDHIVVRQYLLPDFQYEWLLLKYIENAFVGSEFVASFNGKSFDIPLLRNRFVLNRMDSVLDNLIHVDLLHPARRLWKKRLNSCDLVNLEYAILGEERIGDIPGEMIPQIYFEYIRKKQVILMRDVLEHNYYDIAHLVILALHIGKIISNPLKFCQHEEDLYSLASYYYQHDHLSEALPVLQHLYENTKNLQLKKESMFALSMIHKKNGNIKQSGELFQALISTQQDHAEALEELAKYYEHKEKNYQTALEVIDRGIEYSLFLQQLGRESPLHAIRNDLIYRRNRLLRKLNKEKAEEPND